MFFCPSPTSIERPRLVFILFYYFLDSTFGTISRTIFVPSSVVSRISPRWRRQNWRTRWHSFGFRSVLLLAKLFADFRESLASVFLGFLFPSRTLSSADSVAVDRLFANSFAVPLVDWISPLIPFFGGVGGVCSTVSAYKVVEWGITFKKRTISWVFPNVVPVLFSFSFFLFL